MNTQLLIDSIVRQTTVLIAQLSTSGGVRSPLAHLVSQVFLDLSRELEAQGVSRKVSADMFGMALRTYLRRLRRLSESSTERGRSLWEAVYEYLCTQSVATRRQVLSRFGQDEEVVVRGVLHDLTESGLVFISGVEPDAVFRAATADELGTMRHISAGKPDELLWALIYREGPLSLGDLRARFVASTADIAGALERLEGARRVEREESGADIVLRASEFCVPLGAESGWEAAVFDHFHAVVKTICTKLQVGGRGALSDQTGGSTYTFEVWPGHPMDSEVRGFLARFRREQTELRRRVERHNLEQGLPGQYDTIVVYGGQCATAEEKRDNGDD